MYIEDNRLKVGYFNPAKFINLRAKRLMGQKNREPVTDKVKITNVGFVSMLPGGDPLVHEWEFTAATTEEGESYTVGQLKKISEDFFGDWLEYYRGQSKYCLWVGNSTAKPKTQNSIYVKEGNDRKHYRHYRWGSFS